MISEEAHKVTEELFDSLKKRYQNSLEQKWGIVGLSLIMLIYCIINVTE